MLSDRMHQLLCLCLEAITSVLQWHSSVLKQNLRASFRRPTLILNLEDVSTNKQTLCRTQHGDDTAARLTLWPHVRRYSSP